MNKLPEGLVEVAISRQESLGRGLIESHPRYDDVMKRLEECYSMLKGMDFETANKIEDAFTGEIALTFQMAYLLGLQEGFQGGAVLKGGV